MSQPLAITTDNPFAIDIRLEPGPDMTARFEAEVARVVTARGGVVLFHLETMDGEGVNRDVAAVAFGACRDEDIAIISLSADGSTTVEPAADSDAAVAAIAPAFACLAEHWVPANAA